MALTRLFFADHDSTNWLDRAESIVATMSRNRSLVSISPRDSCDGGSQFAGHFCPRRFMLCTKPRYWVRFMESRPKEMQWIRGLFGRASRRPTQATFDASLAPDAPFLVVADIHGRLDLLNDALSRIEALGHSGPLVFVGDYIDRGPDSAAVLRRLFELQSSAPDRVICLAGNHEDMLMGFLSDPVRYQRLWLRNGGTETLLSFGVRAPDTEVEVFGPRDQLLEEMGPELHTWLRNLPVSWSSGNVWVTHAGADPAVDLERQDRHALIWGHPDFRKHTRDDGQWVLHGHTIVPEVKIEGGRISIDTGAYMSGELSVVRVDQHGVTPLFKHRS